MESKEYMEIRNALIVLTKISSVFPVIRKSGVNLEKRVSPLPAIAYVMLLSCWHISHQLFLPGG